VPQPDSILITRLLEANNKLLGRPFTDLEVKPITSHLIKATANVSTAWTSSRVLAAGCSFVGSAPIRHIRFAFHVNGGRALKCFEIPKALQLQS
jgi:hypothetical protein